MNRSQSDVSLFSQSNVDRWRKYRPVAPIRAKKPKSVTDLSAEFFSRYATGAFYALVAVAVICGLAVLGNIAHAFLSGRVDAVLRAARLAH